MMPWPGERVTSPWYDEVFMRFAAEVGGTFLHERKLFGFSKSPKVLVHVKPWTITFDTDEVSGQAGPATICTRVSASYVSKEGFEFEIYRPGLFSKLFALQEADTGYPEFDREFAIQPYGESKARSLIENERIRQLIQSLLIYGDYPVLRAEARDRWLGHQMLSFEEGDMITDVARLKTITDLFVEVLNHLCRIGAAAEEEPKLVL